MADAVIQVRATRRTQAAAQQAQGSKQAIEQWHALNVHCAVARPASALR